MDPVDRIVVSIPLVELWSTSGAVDASPTGRIDEMGIVPLLVSGSTFVVADVGHPLRWISYTERFTFWKTEVKHRLVPSETTTFCLDNYPGQYCYVAFKWECRPSGTVIVLEKHH
jgi:hypothetical protein